MVFNFPVVCSPLICKRTWQRTVVKTRSVEYMPFSLSFFLFLNGGVWSVYSLLVKDYFIGVRTNPH